MWAILNNSVGISKMIMILGAFIATKYGIGGEGKDKLINTLVYLA